MRMFPCDGGPGCRRPSAWSESFPVDFATSGELDSAFVTMTTQKVQTVVVAGSATYVNSRRIADLALAHGLPSSHGFKETVTAGGLLSVGPNLIAMASPGAVLI